MSSKASPTPIDTAPAMKGGGSLWRFLPFVPLLAACLATLAYWPGLVTWDSLRQYDQALSGAFDDWHPPIMEWIWRQMLPLAHSPAPMLILQLSLFALGFALLILWALRKGWRLRAIALPCCALMPISIALMGTVLKDSLMAGALLSATGLVALAETSRAGPATRAARIAALLLCLFAATLRFNAFLAVLPLAVWALPPSFRATPLRYAASALVVLPFLLAAMPVANRLIGAQPSDVDLSLIIFDLGGITEHTGENQFPAMAVRDPVAANQSCYTPVKWDSYSWWVDPLCPINFEAVRTAFLAQRINPKLFWVSAILHHPLAYLEHRFAHWNIEIRFLVPDEIERPVQVEAPPNDWGFAITPNPVVRAVDLAARASAHTPLGWPCAWIALMAGLAWAGRRAPLGMAAQTLLWSALLYALGYAAFGVAAELRYYLWTMLAGAIATVIALPALRGGKALSLLTLPAIISVLCVAARLLSL